MNIVEKTVNIKLPDFVWELFVNAKNRDFKEVYGTDEVDLGEKEINEMLCDMILNYTTLEKGSYLFDSLEEEKAFASQAMPVSSPPLYKKADEWKQKGNN